MSRGRWSGKLIQSSILSSGRWNRFNCTQSTAGQRTKLSCLHVQSGRPHPTQRYSLSGSSAKCRRRRSSSESARGSSEAGSGNANCMHDSGVSILDSKPHRPQTKFERCTQPKMLQKGVPCLVLFIPPYSRDTGARNSNFSASTLSKAFTSVCKASFASSWRPGLSSPAPHCPRVVTVSGM